MDTKDESVIAATGDNGEREMFNKCIEIVGKIDISDKFSDHWQSGFFQARSDAVRDLIIARDAATARGDKVSPELAPVCGECGHRVGVNPDGTCRFLYIDSDYITDTSPTSPCGHKCAPCSQCESNARWNEAGGYPRSAAECRAYCLRGHRELCNDYTPPQSAQRCTLLSGHEGVHFVEDVQPASLPQPGGGLPVVEGEPYNFPISEHLPFDYSGPVYFRPIGRGISFPDDCEIDKRGLQLEDLFEGNYHMTIRIDALPTQAPESALRGHNPNDTPASSVLHDPDSVSATSTPASEAKGKVNDDR